jgi:hypothetical protein
MKGVATTMGVAAVAGFVAGFVVLGGLLRLAMFVLRLTSPSVVIGVESDFGATIGRFSAAGTGLFMLGCAAVGATAGLIYLVIRPIVASRRRAPVAALIAGTFGPAVIIDPDGLDFAILEPALLAVAMFVVALAAFGLAVSLAVEWLLRVSWWRESPRAWIAMGPLLLAGLAASGPFAPLILLVAAGVGVYRTRSSSPSRPPRRGVAWAAQIGVVAAIGLSAAFLAMDIAAVV